MKTHLTPYYGAVTISNGSISSNEAFISNANSYSFSQPKKKYNVLGEEFELTLGYGLDFNIGMYLSTLNVIGIRFYTESKKNMSLSFIPQEIVEYLENEEKRFNRSEKIEKIIE